MKVQQIKQSASLTNLEDWGVNTAPDGATVKLSGIQKVIKGSEAIDTGVFESEPGRYRRTVKQAEVMHFVAGKGQFTADGEETVYFQAGDTLFFEANTEGLWIVEEAMRKIYVIF